MRNVINQIFGGPINSDSPDAIKAIGHLITGRQLNPDDKGDEYTIIHVDHPLRRGHEEFVLCPLDAKPNTPISTLHALKLAGHKEFLAVLQNLGRIGAVFDNQGLQINQFAQSPFMQMSSSNPIANIIHGFLFFEVLAFKTPRMDEALLRGIDKQNGKHDMTEVFKRKVVNSDSEFILDSGLFALMDYFAATSLWASLQATPVVEMRAFFELRKKQYESLNGVGGSRNFREEMQRNLEEYLDKFPNTLMKVRKSKKPSKSPAVSVVDLTAAELSNWASGPAGGEKIVVESLAHVGEDAAAERAETGSGAGAEGNGGGSSH